MPSLEHEFPLNLIRHSPDLAAHLLAHASQTSLPAFTQARCESGEATTTAPAELRADSVVVLDAHPPDGDGAGRPALAVIVECQTGYDARKRYSWPSYVAHVRARLECPVVLLVLTPNRRVARWCSAPIDLGCGYLVHRPLALALSALEPVTDPHRARAHPELAVLAAAVHHAEDTAVLDALLPALDALDQSTTTLYSDYVLAALPDAARKYLEDTVRAGTYEFKTDFIGRPYREGRTEGLAEGHSEGLAEGRTEGLAEGRSTAVLTVLDSRGIPVTETVRARITACTDPEQLDTWVRRAVTVAHADELFD